MPAVVRIESSTACLAARAEVANTFRSRLVGLVGRDRLAPGTALVLQPSGLIHTAFMRFPIDVVFLDGRRRVVATATHVDPFRIAWGGWKARMAVELPAGTIERFELVAMVGQIAWNARGDLADLDDLPGAFHSAQSIPLVRARDRRRQVADDLFEGLQSGRLGFWTHVHEPFLQRDITREDMRDLIRRGLAEGHGSYRNLLRVFRMPDTDYKRLLNFLSAHQCTVDSREFRVTGTRA